MERRRCDLLDVSVSCTTAIAKQYANKLTRYALWLETELATTLVTFTGSALLDDRTVETFSPEARGQDTRHACQ